MDFNQFRLEQRATLVAQYDMKRTVYRNEIEDWIARYPQLEAALRQRYEEYSLSLDKEIAHFDSGQYQVDFDTSIETAKRKYWELLTLLNTADPALPIVEMHDEYCAAMDQAAMEARSQVRKLDELAEQTRVAMTDVVIDHHLARREAQGTWGFVAYVTQNTDISIEEATKAMGEAGEIVVSRSSDVELFPDAPEVLKELKDSGKHLALITTSERRMIMPALEKYKIADLFETIVTDDDVEKSERKPHPKPLLMALERMGGTPDKAIMVGDRDKDILGGHNAGIDSVLFYSVEHQRHYKIERFLEHKPTYIISEFRELIKVVNSTHAPVEAR